MDRVPESVVRVQLRTLAAGARTYPAIVVHMADLQLSADLVNDRQVRLAQRLAESHGVTMEVAPELQLRVTRALAVADGVLA